MNRRTGALVLAAAGAIVAACAREEPQAVPGPTVAVIQVVDETYTIELESPELVDNARRLLEGTATNNIPIGKIVRDDPSVNEPWSWHIDPATLQFAEVTMEVCDGRPSYVEDETLTSDFYCPWDATVISVERLES